MFVRCGEGNIIIKYFHCEEEGNSYTLNRRCYNNYFLKKVDKIYKSLVERRRKKLKIIRNINKGIKLDSFSALLIFSFSIIR